MDWLKKASNMKKKANGPCPLCGSPMAKRKGPYGEFFGCSKYPQCKGVRKLNEAPAAPQNRQPQAPQPRPPQAAIPQPEKQRTWILATMLATGEPVVAAKGATGWDYQTENGDFGTIPNAEVAKTIKSVEENGQKVSGTNPAILFNKYHQLNPKAQEAEQQQPEVPGRIPANRISPQQKDIENSFLNTPQSIMINALAGSGKTTMLRHLASFKPPGEKWLYLVFNKKNQVEASTGKGKFPNGVEVKTSHSFLGQVLGRSSELNMIQHTDLWNNFGERITQILDHMMERDNTFPQSVKYVAKQTIKQLASLSKAFAVHPQSQNAAQQMTEIIRQYNIDTDLSPNKDKQPNAAGVNYAPQIIDKALDLLHYCLPGNAPTPELNSMRDHDDTLWYSAINDVKWPHFDVVLADEVQDFNTCQTIMLQKLSQAGARVIAVGDPNQAIYMFRGADAQAFQKVQGVLGQAPNGNVPHELPVNYRSGRAIIKYVNEKTHVKNLQAGRDFDGQVTEGRKVEEAMGDIFNEKRQRNRLAEQTAFIARTNSPLVKTALELMKNNVEFVIIGRDFSKELVDHIEKITGKGRMAKKVPIRVLGETINNFLSERETAWKGKIARESELKDMKATTEALSNVIEYLAASGYRDPQLNMRVDDSTGFIEYIKKKFAGVNMDNAEEAEALKKKDPLSYVTLTSAHRSKGLEFDRVFILEPNLFPHPKAKTPEELLQEENAKYVAYTRAMKGLHVLAPSKEEKKEKREASSKVGWYVKAKSTKKKRKKKK